MTFLFDPNAYGPAIATLLVPERVCELGPGSPNLAMRSALETLKAPAVCRAGLWLLHDFLDESHSISQDLGTKEGSFWHAIMHRREGDFSNSKYWYARCANHPALATLGVQAASVVNPFPADKSLLRLVRDGFDPSAFVDLVERVHEHVDDPHRPLAVALQRLEWRVLFDHCTRAATSG